MEINRSFSSPVYPKTRLPKLGALAKPSEGPTRDPVQSATSVKKTWNVGARVSTQGPAPHSVDPNAVAGSEIDGIAPAQPGDPTASLNSIEAQSSMQHWGEEPAMPPMRILPIIGDLGIDPISRMMQEFFRMIGEFMRRFFNPWNWYRN